MDHYSTAHRQIRRIGLISPTSSNLGNAAMQAAVIANVRKRIAGIEILGITLNPEETGRRLGVEAFPLAGVSRPYYGLFNSAGLTTEQPRTPEFERIKKGLKQIPVLRTFLRAIRICVMELAHITAAARVVRKLDCIMIPGGGTLDDFWGGPWGQPWALFKWSLLSRVYGVPFLFVSIGKSSLERPLSRFFARVALRLAAYRSYRDKDSKMAVQSLIDAHDDPVYPDLAFSYPCPVLQTPRHYAPPDDRLMVGVNPIAHCDPRVSPLKDERRYTEYLGRLAEVVKWLLRQGHRIVFFTTDPGDRTAVDDIQAIISGCPRDTDAIQTLPSSTEQSVDGFLKNISGVDLTIASRLHGVILSHLNATPVLALSFDPKVDAHMNAIDQKDYCLNIDHWEVETLIARFVALKSARKREQDRIRCAALRFRCELDLQYERILGTRRMAVTGECQDQVDRFQLSGTGSIRGK
jgi:polysaccharide pyruvyl transferase WcaK-like protein